MIGRACALGEPGPPATGLGAAPKALALAVLTVLLACAAPGPADAAVPGANGRIFFTSASCGVASIRADGSGFTCISAAGRDPTVAPNGQRIAFTRGNQVSVMAADGGGRRQLTGPIDGWDQAYTPSFGPDSETIAYLAFSGSSSGIRGDIYTIQAGGAGGRRLTTVQAYDPSYAGDGRIAYDRFDGIYVMNGDGSGQHRVLANVNETSLDPPGRLFVKNDEPAFSPDGRTIAFTRTTLSTRYICNPFPNCTDDETTSDVDVWLVNADGSGERRLTSTPAVDEVDPSISPDGTRVVYFHWPEKDQGGDRPPEATGELWTVGTDAGGARRLVRGSNPEWTGVTGGPARPKLRVSGVPRGCARGTFGIRLEVVSTAAAPTTMTFRLDGRYRGSTNRKRWLFRVYSYEAKRHGAHRLKVVVRVGPDTLTRTIRFRRC